MTIKENAEKYANDKADKGNYDYAVGDNVYFCKSALEHAYIAGATENGIQWHDLRKDPNDLPKGQINRYLFGYVKNYGGKKPMLISYNGEWFYNANTYNDEVKVIAWCEIPQFDSEK